jgi:hypothetical protein
MERKETTVLGPGPNRVEVPECWNMDWSMRVLCYTPHQWIDLAKEFEPPNNGEGTLQITVRIPYVAYRSLLDYVAQTEKGVLRTDRAEDLKLVHRLLDILTKAIDKKP